MEISILKSTEYSDSSGITDANNTYDSSEHRTYLQDEILQSGTGVYQRTGADFLPDIYNVADEQNYLLNQVLYKDGLVQFITQVAGIGAKQPNEYVPAPPETLDFGSWGSRYAKLGVLDPNTDTWSKNTDATGENRVTHSLRLENGQWIYKILRTVSSKEWGSDKYDGSFPPTYFEYRDYQQLINIVWKGATVYTGSSATEPPAGTIYNGNDGNRYMKGIYKTDTYRWSVKYEETVYTDIVHEENVTLLNASSLDVDEEKAYCVDGSLCSGMWLPKTIIRIGNDLYIRTDTNDTQETKTLAAPETTELSEIGLISWGWTYTSPTNVFAPLDGKKYTYVQAGSPLMYEVYGSSLFDTIAINGLIADEVQIEFLPDDGSAAIPVVIMNPNNNRDDNNRLPKYQTTLIAYAPRDITGKVRITFTAAGEVRIGGITLGMSVNAGFTNLVFTNKFNDYSPFEKDQFGNILYVDGVKTNVYTGTVDIPLTSYDMTNRLMASIGGKTVILNGSDSKDNQPVDNINFFASTMVVGRIRNFTLRTKLDNSRMAQKATYNFEIEEDV